MLTATTLASTTESVGRYRWNVVRILFAVAVVLYVDRINITIAAPSLADEFSLNPAQLGRVLSAFLFGYAFGLAPGGYLADRIGPHRLIIGAGVSWAIVTCLTACVPSGHPQAAMLLMTARFLLGLCEACALPTFNRAIANWMLKHERAKASGWVHCGAGVGGAITPLLIAWLIGHYGWRAAFVASGILTLGVCIWWWRGAADEPSKHVSVGQAERDAIEREQGSVKAASPDRPWLLRLIRSREAYLLCASLFFFGVAQFVYITWFYTYFVRARGATALNAAVLSSLPYLAIAIGSPLGGFLSDASERRFGAPWGRRIAPLFGLALAGVCASIAPLIPENIPAAALFGAAAGLQFAAAPSYWSTIIDITRRGTGLLGGFMNGANYLGSALATTLFPGFVEQMGWTRAIQCAGFAALIAAILWIGIHSSRRIDPADALQEHVEKR